MIKKCPWLLAWHMSHDPCCSPREPLLEPSGAPSGALKNPFWSPQEPLLEPSGSPDGALRGPCWSTQEPLNPPQADAGAHSRFSVMFYRYDS